MKLVEKAFLSLLDSKKTRKISLNLSEDLIGVLDDFSKSVNLTRTVIIESILRIGFGKYVKIIDKGLTELLKQETTGKERFREIKKNLIEFKKKYSKYLIEY